MLTTLIAGTLLMAQGAGTIGFDKAGSTVQQLSTGTVSWLQPLATNGQYSEVKTTTWSPTSFVGMSLNITAKGFKKATYNRIYQLTIERELVLTTTTVGGFSVKSVNPNFYNPSLTQDEANTESFYKDEAVFLVVIPAGGTGDAIKYGYSSIEFTSVNPTGMELNVYHRVKSWTLL